MPVRGRVGAEPALRLLGGKGGVGKTTLAVAEAMRAVRGGARVLLVSMDPAHSLGDALGAKLGAKPRPVKLPGTGSGMGRGKLVALELDADLALERWLAERRSALRAIAERGTYLDDDDVDRLFGLSLPGVDELVGLVELARLAKGPYDLVVVDTAPTGHTLRLLAMPETLGRIAVVLGDMQAKHRFMAESLGGGYRRDRSDSVIDELAAEASALAAWIRDPARCQLTWATLPEEVALEETRDGIAALAADGIRVEKIVVNRVTRAARRCERCTARRKMEARVIAAVRKIGPPVELVAEIVSKRTTGGGRPERKDTRPIRSLPWLGKRLVMVGGKGGVGKSTIAAGIAAGLAAAGKRTLLFSTDPAHSAGDVLAVKAGDRAARVSGMLFVRELDAARVFEDKRERYRRAVDELFDTVSGGSRFDATFDRAVVRDLIDLAPPGLDELFAIVSLIDLVVSEGAPWDVIVLDMAPTGHALRLLEMPAAAQEWVKTLLEILLKYRQVIGLGELASDLVVLSRELRALGALLQDRKRTCFVAVTRADVLPRVETVRLIAALGRLGIALAAVVVNALTAPRAGCARCAAAAAREQTQLGLLAREVPDGCAILRALEIVPPPRGIRAVRALGKSLTPA